MIQDLQQRAPPQNNSLLQSLGHMMRRKTYSIVDLRRDLPMSSFNFFLLKQDLKCECEKQSGASLQLPILLFFLFGALANQSLLISKLCKVTDHVTWNFSLHVIHAETGFCVCLIFLSWILFLTIFTVQTLQF